MTNMNFSILKRNISNLMENNSMTQADLASVTGMSQSNVSKCLKIGDDTRSFTLEQICAIADHFGKSVDELLGRNSTKRDISVKDICSFLVSLFENDVIKNIEIEQTETIYEPQMNPYDKPSQPKDETIKYNAFYFSDYWLPDTDDPQYGGMQQAELEATGNQVFKHMKINDFMSRYLRTLKEKQTGHITAEDYEILLDAYFKTIENV